MVAIREAYDLTCVIHVHSTYSDGTGTVAQIARAAQRAGIDVVLLTDHDTLEAKRRGEERWYDGVLVLVGEEVSPTNRDHFLAFGIDKEISQVAGARGFAFWSDTVRMGGEVTYERGVSLHVRTPQAAEIRLVRDGEVIATADSDELHHGIEQPGIHRAEAALAKKPWIYSNPVYVRS